MNDHHLQKQTDLVTGTGMWHIGDNPSIAVSDGPNGLRKQSEEAATNNDSILSTCYPTEVTLADSWNTEMVQRVADALAEECIKEDVSILLGPGVNIKRTPLGGRNFEYFSEDPYLSGKLGAAYIHAIEERNVGTSLKHFAGNSQERFRMTYNSEIDERALHEIYLRAFEIAVTEGKPSTVMASYNRLNGVYSCQNHVLLTDILRRRWKYEGAVISDWGACTDLPASVKAGMDLEMPDSKGFHRPDLEQALNEDTDGTMHQALERAAGNVDRLIQSSETKKVLHGTDCHAIAREAAVDGAVLLKNEGALPLEENAKVYAAGPLLEKMRIQGGGSSHIHIRKDPDMKAALEKEYPLVKEPGDADLILYFGGLSEETEGEGFDRETLELSEKEVRDIRNMLDTGRPMVFIAFGGSPFVIPYRDEMKAILYMGLPGEAADEAVMELISGRTSPGGRLSETWPLSLADVPCRDCCLKDTRDIEYRESIYAGYRYYDTFHVPVQYSFGHGLSYTQFRYTDLHCSKNEVSATVENTGAYDGAEVVQIYIENPQSDYLREKRSLHGFCKVFLRKGEKKTVRIALDDRAFQIWSPERNDYITVSGDYIIEAGSGLNDIRLRQPLHVDGVQYERNDREICPACFREGMKPAFTAEGFRKLYERDGHQLSDFTHRGKGKLDRTASLREMTKTSPLAGIFVKIARKEMHRMYPGKDMNDPEVRMTWEGLMDGTIDAAAIQSGGAISQNLMQALIADANGHHAKAIGKLLGIGNRNRGEKV